MVWRLCAWSVVAAAAQQCCRLLVCFRSSGRGRKASAGERESGREFFPVGRDLRFGHRLLAPLPWCLAGVLWLFITGVAPASCRRDARLLCPPPWGGAPHAAVAWLSVGVLGAGAACSSACANIGASVSAASSFAVAHAVAEHVVGVVWAMHRWPRALRL